MPNLVELADIAVCTIGNFLTTSLGLPLGTKHKAIDIWNGVIEKFEKRLASWKKQYLSVGGRSTLSACLGLLISQKKNTYFEKKILFFEKNGVW